MGTLSAPLSIILIIFLLIIIYPFSHDKTICTIQPFICKRMRLKETKTMRKMKRKSKNFNKVVLMDAIDDLYQEIIIEHSKAPCNEREMPHATHVAQGYNPLCGDQVTVYLHLDKANKVRDISFIGEGCAICTASASLMTAAVQGLELERKQLKPVIEAVMDYITTGAYMESIFEQTDALPSRDPIRETAKQSLEPPECFEDLKALSGVRQFPVRIKCATLPWHTLAASLRGATARISNEHMEEEGKLAPSLQKQHRALTSDRVILA